MRLIPVCLLLLLAFAGGCKKEKSDKSCIRAKITVYLSNKCSEGPYVKEYRFQGKPAYLFFEGLCYPDAPSEVYDEQCNFLGYFGGISGHSIVQGADFREAVYVRTIWPR